MTSKDDPILTLSEIAEILDLVIRSSAEKDQLLAHLRDGRPAELLGKAVITPVAVGPYLGTRKDGAR